MFIRYIAEVGDRFGFFHGSEHGGIAAGEIAQDPFGILVGPVPEADDLAAVGMAEQLGRKADARRVGAEVFGGHAFSVQDEGKGLGDELALIAEVDAGVQSEIARAVREGIEGAGAGAADLLPLVVEQLGYRQRGVGVHQDGHRVDAHRQGID